MPTRFLGSSPLARGAQDSAIQKLAKSGLIPARAGSTQAAPLCIGYQWAHPRSRGEHSYKAS